MWDLRASALMAAGVMSAEPTMYWFFKLVATVLRPLTPITIAVMPKMMRIAAEKKPPISSTLRISCLLLELPPTDACTVARTRAGGIRAIPVAAFGQLRCRHGDRSRVRHRGRQGAPCRRKRRLRGRAPLGPARDRRVRARRTRAGPAAAARGRRGVRRARGPGNTRYRGTAGRVARRPRRVRAGGRRAPLRRLRAAQRAGALREALGRRFFGEQVVRDRVADELGAARDVQLAHDVRAVRLGGADRDVELPPDLLIRVPQCEQAQDLALALAQRIVGRTPLRGRVRRNQPRAELGVDVAAASRNLADGVDHLGIRGLLEDV